MARADLTAVRAENAASEVAWQRKLEQQLAVNRNLQSDLSMIYERNKREVAQLEAQYKHDDYKQLYTAARGKIQRLEGAIAGVRQCRDKLANTGKMQALTANALQHAWMELRQEREAHHANVQHHERETTGFLADAAVFAAEKGTMESELAHLRATVEHATNQYTAAQEEAAALQARVTALEGELQNLTTEYHACQEQLANIPVLETHVAALEDKCNKLSFENDMQQDTLASIPALQAEKTTLAETVAELRAQIAATSTLSTQEHVALEQALAEQVTVLASTAAQLEAKTHEYNELSDFMEEERVVRAEVRMDAWKTPLTTPLLTTARFMHVIALSFVGVM